MKAAVAVGIVVAAFLVGACAASTRSVPGPTITVTATTTQTATSVTTRVRTETVTSIAVQAVTETVPVAVTEPVSTEPVPTPQRQPQGTVTITFVNDVSDQQNCSNTIVTVHNRSDTPVLSISVTFRPSWFAQFDTRPYVRTENEPEIGPLTEPVGAPAFSTDRVAFAVCTRQPSFSLAHSRSASVAAVPKSFTWQWAQD